MRVRHSFTIALLGLVLLLLLTAPALAQTFPDVHPSHAYYTAIEEMAERGIIGGYTNGNFGPQDPVMRQQFAKMAVKTLDLTVTGSEACPFTDVGPATGSDPFYPAKYIAVCAARNITVGKTPTTFAPYANITRQQVVTMVVRAADNLAPGTLAPAPSGWSGSLSYGDPTHGANIKKAEYNGLLGGIYGPSGTWNTTSNASRGECAQILYNLLLKLDDDEPPTGDTGTVTSVTDGDTIHVQVAGQDKTVRLIGIDTPETGEPFSAEAKQSLANLVSGKTVRLEQDVTATDQYGRTLAYVWVGSTMANREMLRLGMATLYTVPPNVKYVDMLRAAEDEAKNAKRGIWAGTTTCPVEVVSVFPDAPGNDNDNPNGEYVTFKVLVSGTLLGYAVEDATGHRYEFPDRVFTSGQAFKLRSGSGTDTQSDLYWGSSSAIWNNTGGDTVKVLDPQGHIVESYSY